MDIDTFLAQWSVDMAKLSRRQRLDEFYVKLTLASLKVWYVLVGLYIALWLGALFFPAFLALGFCAMVSILIGVAGIAVFCLHYGMLFWSHRSLRETAQVINTLAQRLRAYESGLINN